MGRKLVKGLSLLSFAVGSFAFSAEGAVVFRDGITNEYATNYTGTQDVILAPLPSASPDPGLYNQGAAANIVTANSSSSRRRSLLSFDLSSLAGQGLTIDSAVITLTKGTGSGADTEKKTLSAWALKPENAGWIEGTGALLGTARDGEVTSNFKAYNSQGGSVPWSDGGGQISTLLHTTTTTALVTASSQWAQSDAVGTKYDIVLPISLVQQWIDTPSGNAGLYLANDGNSVGVSLAASENSNAGYRPTLTLNFVPEPSMIGPRGGWALRARTTPDASRLTGWTN